MSSQFVPTLVVLHMFLADGPVEGASPLYRRVRERSSSTYSEIVCLHHTDPRGDGSIRRLWIPEWEPACIDHSARESVWIPRAVQQCLSASVGACYLSTTSMGIDGHGNREQTRSFSCECYIMKIWRFLLYIIPLYNSLTFLKNVI